MKEKTEKKHSFGYTLKGNSLFERKTKYVIKWLKLWDRNFLKSNICSSLICLLFFLEIIIDFLSTKHKEPLNLGHAKQTFIQIMDTNYNAYMFSKMCIGQGMSTYVHSPLPAFKL